MQQETAGGSLEVVAEFEVAGGSEIPPHSHHALELYYILSGKGVMVIEDEDQELLAPEVMPSGYRAYTQEDVGRLRTIEREVGPGDFICIPPDKMHTLRPLGDRAPIRALAVMIALADSPEFDYGAI
jgi:mannose-6-phosphate isomerase-like protein (cupin superfamily)